MFTTILPLLASIHAYPRLLPQLSGASTSQLLVSTPMVPALWRRMPSTSPVMATPTEEEEDRPADLRSIPGTSQRDGATKFDGQGRRPYLLTGLPRPKYRGALVGFLHRTRLWYICAALYLIAALRRSAASSVPLTAVEKTIRVIAAAASSANIFVSDAYHNADLKPGCYTREHELFWMRCDYFGISAVLAYNQFLWSGNIGWRCRSRLAAAYSALCLGTIGIAAPRLSGSRDGSTKLVKYLTGTQFLPAMTYLVLVMHASTGGGLIYALYATGLCLYVAKVPQSANYGFHEIFHSLVVLGHLASMGFDLRDITTPIARVAAGTWVHTSPPMVLESLPFVAAPWCLLFVLLPNKRRLMTKLAKLMPNKKNS